MCTFVTQQRDRIFIIIIIIIIIIIGRRNYLASEVIRDWELWDRILVWDGNFVSSSTISTYPVFHWVRFSWIRWMQFVAYFLYLCNKLRDSLLLFLSHKRQDVCTCCKLCVS